MPLFYQQHINQHTKLAIWKIEEAEDYFSSTVPVQREITHPHKRLQHLAARYLLRYLFPDFPYNEILIADTRKPYLENETYHFSISHCGDYAAAIVSKTERVGIDIEISSEKILKIAHKFTDNDELRIVNDELNYKQETKNDLTLIWSAKETMFKWYGLGNVDFKEMLKIDSLQENNTLKTRLLTPQRIFDLDVHFKFFNVLMLTFANTS